MHDVQRPAAPAISHDPFDARIQEMEVRRGVITAEQVLAMREALPDEAEHAVESSIRFVATWGKRYASRRRHG